MPRPLWSTLVNMFVCLWLQLTVHQTIGLTGCLPEYRAIELMD